MVVVDLLLLQNPYKTRFHTAKITVPPIRELAGKHVEPQEVYIARLNQSLITQTKNATDLEESNKRVEKTKIF